MNMIKKSAALVSVFALALSTTAFTADDVADDANVVEPQIVEGAPAEEVAQEQAVEAAVTSDQPATGQEIAAGVCAGCHGADGNSIIPNFPSLAGQHAEYLFKQLMEFKAEEGGTAVRQSEQMTPMVAALSEEDMANLADFYASQQAAQGTLIDDEDLIETGRIIYHGGNIENGVPACASCHGPTGAGIPPHYPALAGQHSMYTLAQLDLFNKGKRTNDNKVMQQVLTRLSGKEKRAVSAYIQGMHQ